MSAATGPTERRGAPHAVPGVTSGMAQGVASGGGPSGPLPIEYSVATELEERAESVLKWVWLAWMIFALSMFLPAFQVWFQNRMESRAGWQVAMAAQAVVLDVIQGTGFPGRRIRPFTPEQAVALAGVGTLANWMVILSGSAALLGVRKPLAGRYMRIALVGSLMATVLAAGSSAIVIYARGLTPLPGVYAWWAAPIIMTIGLARQVFGRRGES